MLSLFVLLTVFCSFTSAEFDDSLARNFMMPLSSAAYSDAPQQCLDSKLSGAKLSKQVIVKCDFLHDKCSGFTFVDEKRQVIGLAFRGSSDPNEFVLETGFQKMVDFKEGGKVSKYFNSAFETLWDAGLGEDLEMLASNYADYDLWITGHSLGGAIASLASAHIASLDWIDSNRTLVYTFGQPRTGDQTYAVLHDNLVPSTFRVVHDHDFVVHTPPNYTKFVHHRFEVFYDNDMKDGAPYTVCAEQEDKKCSDKYLYDTSVSDHTYYYGKAVADFGLRGCK